MSNIHYPSLSAIASATQGTGDRVAVERPEPRQERRLVAIICACALTAAGIVLAAFV